MNYRHLRSGIFFISIGIVILLINFRVVDGGAIIRTLLEYWPIIFIFIGLSIIFHKNQIARSAIWLLFLVTLVGFSYFNNSLVNSRTGGWTASPNVNINKNAAVERASIRIGLGGSKISINSSDGNLVDAYISDSDIVHRESYSNDGRDASIEFEDNNNVFVWPGYNDEAVFALNKDVSWDMELDTGAVSGIVDMSGLKVDRLDIKTGAASFKLIFGSKNTEARIKAGASSFDIVVPKDSGVRVDMDGALIGNNLDELGWDKQGDYYYSPNYNSDESKINIEVDMGVGSFDIEVQ